MKVMDQQNTPLKCQVILLPTNESNKCTGLEITSVGNELYYHKPTKEEIGKPLGTIYGKSIPQHLYFVSNEPIEKGNWCFANQGQEIFYWKHESQPAPECFAVKIEATTDSNLNLPLVPQSFIERYVKEQGNIKEVELLYNEDIGLLLESNYSVRLINPKQSWSREEVYQLMVNSMEWAKYRDKTNIDIQGKQWIENNLK